MNIEVIFFVIGIIFLLVLLCCVFCPQFIYSVFSLLLISVRASQSSKNDYIPFINEQESCFECDEKFVPNSIDDVYDYIENNEDVSDEIMDFAIDYLDERYRKDRF